MWTLTVRKSLIAALVVGAIGGALWWWPGGTPVSQAGGGPQVHTIAVGDFWFCGQEFEGGECETVIDAGDSVVWDFSGASATHTTTACGASCDSPAGMPLWDSGLLSGGSFTFLFPLDRPGTYEYHCTVHPTLMRGRIVVQGELPTPTPPAPGVPGDANCNRTVDAIDATLMLQLSAGLLHELACQGDADVNGDGRVDAIDASLVLQFTAGLLETLPP